jgi:hypothetical protein
VDPAGQHDAHDAGDASRLVATDRVSSAWALHHSPRAVLAMLVLELAGLAVLQWQHGRLQAGSRQGALAIVETLHDEVVVIGADGSIAVRAGPGASAS